MLKTQRQIGSHIRKVLWKTDIADTKYSSARRVAFGGVMTYVVSTALIIAAAVVLLDGTKYFWLFYFLTFFFPTLKWNLVLWHSVSHIPPNFRINAKDLTLMYRTRIELLYRYVHLYVYISIFVGFQDNVLLVPQTNTAYFHIKIRYIYNFYWINGKKF